MFLRAEAKPVADLRPSTSNIAISDWTVLADFWHPVALARDVVNEPVAATLLDVELVLFRSADGTVSAAVDLCPHRHVRLSPGRVVDGQIECPFHGLRFDGSGRCTRVPAIGDRAKLPATYRVRTFPTAERYGLVWTCIGDADANPVPHFPNLAGDDPSTFGYLEPSVWPVSAARQVENFTDLAHLPLVHAETLGGDIDAPIKAGRIEHTDDAFVMRAEYVETGPGGSPMPCTLTYRVVLPFAVEFETRSHDAAGHRLWSCDVPSPTTAHQCTVFQVVKTEGDAHSRNGVVSALQVVNEEDQRVLATLRNPDLPLNQHHEIHLPVDNVSAAYRSRLRALGLGQE